MTDVRITNNDQSFIAICLFAIALSTCQMASDSIKVRQAIVTQCADDLPFQRSSMQ